MGGVKLTVVMMFKTPFKIEKLYFHSNRYVVAEDLVWHDEATKYTVPAGYSTDLTTYWIEGRHTPAAVLHDYVLSVTDKDFKQANEVMRRAMVWLKVRPWHIKIIMAGILAGRIFNIFKRANAQE